jgi:carnitine O-palmitoyltransferase 2
VYQLGNILPPSDLLSCVDYILKDNSPAAEFPIGVLTSENRDVWAKARQELEAQGNGDAFNAIDTSIFNLALDDETMDNDRDKMLRHYLHSDGANRLINLQYIHVASYWFLFHPRWFDKSFSLILTKDGTAGINFEHSWGDGVAVLRYFTDMFKDSTNQPQIHPETKPSGFDAAGHVRKLGMFAFVLISALKLNYFEEFKLNDSIKNSISEAKKKHMDISKSLGFDVLAMHNFGKKLCKKHKVSPDAIMQLGFQVNKC